MSKVLLVTHTSDPLNALAAALYERGHDVSTADPWNAIELAAQTRFDAVVTEYVIDGQLNGLQMIKALRRVRADLHAVLMTAVVTTDVQSAVAELCNVEILRKPFNMRQLEVAIG